MLRWLLPRRSGALARGGSEAGRAPAITPAEWHEAIRSVDPEAYLVEPRVLRRVIRHDHGVGILGRHAAGRQCYAIEANRAATFLDRDELGLPPDAKLPTFLLLIARPEERDLASKTAEDCLVDAWRLLFHARVLAEAKGLAASGYLDPAAVRGRIDRIGQTEFDEIRSVLRQEYYVQDTGDAVACYVEFVALYAELRYFAPDLLPQFFPSLGDASRVDAVLAEDVDLDAIRSRCRPPGAPEPAALAPGRDDLSDDPDLDDLPEVDEDTDPWVETRWVYRFLIRKAHQAAAQGNHVRGAVRRLRAARFAPPGWAESTRESARRELERLAHQLGPALGLEAAEVSLWRKALPPLAHRAGRGIWSREARLLYDLQKVVVDHHRKVYTVDLVEWARTLGRRPIRRVLPYHREVLIVQHLVSARRRLLRLRLPEDDRERLTRLLNSAVDRSRRHLRETFRPVVDSTLRRTGWVPANLPEELALEKLTEELIDRVVDRGFLRMGDLRDAVSRSNLKLPDLAGPVELWRGDRLLQTDRALATEADGVYHRGEIYLRWLQRMSSLAFGSRLGRLLTLYVALPFGVSYVTLKGLDHLFELVAEWLDGPHVHVYHPYSFVALGVLVLGLVNSPRFRGAFFRWVRQAGQLIRGLLLDLPRWAIEHPVLRLILESPPVRFAVRWLLKPSIFAMGTAGMLRLLEVPWFDTGVLASVAFVASGLLLNSRTGRDVEEILADRALRFWQRFLRDLIPGLFRLVMETFDRLLEALERLLYAVDEWLRFKSGQGPITLALKAVVGLFWSVVTYVVRVYVVLLIEPQVNPIKHFPVVTVSHKLMLPFLPTLLVLLRTPLMPLGRWTAESIAWTTLLLLPGVFGFLVWELKENWKLYEANRARSLKPVVIGHHGETMLRLIRPGFHSGTIPKLFAKLRRAGRKASFGSRRRPRPSRKFREKLHHVEVEVRNFVEREFIALLDLSRALARNAITLGEVHLGTNRVRLHLEHREHPGSPLVVAFEEQSGWLVAGIAEPGWLPERTADEQAAFRDALAGLYKLSGVDLVREQLEACLGPDRPPYDITNRGLVIWPDSGYRRELVVHLRPGDGTLSGPSSLPSPGDPRNVDACGQLFSQLPLPWGRWVEIWERDREGQGHPSPAAPGVRLLPILEVATEPAVEDTLIGSDDPHRFA